MNVRCHGRLLRFYVCMQETWFLLKHVIIVVLFLYFFCGGLLTVTLFIIIPSHQDVSVTQNLPHTQRIILRTVNTSACNFSIVRCRFVEKSFLEHIHPVIRWFEDYKLRTFLLTKLNLPKSFTRRCHRITESQCWRFHFAPDFRWVLWRILLMINSGFVHCWLRDRHCWLLTLQRAGRLPRQSTLKVCVGSLGCYLLLCIHLVLLYINLMQSTVRQQHFLSIRESRCIWNA